MGLQSCGEQVSDWLRVEILLGNFEPGESIREVPVAERFKVSRGPVRDAFRQLSKEGFLDFVPNRGVRVGDICDEKMRSFLAKMRYQVERFAITELVKDPSGEFLRSIRQNLREYQLFCDDENRSEVVHLDLVFHRILVRSCGCKGLESVWLSLLRGLSVSYAGFGSFAESSFEHHRIVESIERRDASTAIAIMKKHTLVPYRAHSNLSRGKSA